MMAPFRKLTAAQKAAKVSFYNSIFGDNESRSFTLFVGKRSATA